MNARSEATVTPQTKGRQVRLAPCGRLENLLMFYAPNIFLLIGVQYGAEEKGKTWE